MALSKVEQREKEILAWLGDDTVTTIVLFGERGIGKTWMARKICNQMSNGLFDITLWVFLNRTYDNWTLYENIACQLSLLSTAEEKEDDDDRKEEVEEDKEKSLENLKQKIKATLARKRCLLILDDAGNKMNEEEIMSKLRPLNHQNKCKVLITRITSDDGDMIEENKTVKVEVKPLPEAESLQLLQDRARISDSDVSRFKSEFNAVIKKSAGLPAAIIVIAELLRYLREHNGGVWTRALEEVAYNKNYHATQLLCSAFDMLPRADMIDCCWHSRQFFHDHGSVHYNELITYWILEGFLGDVDHIEKAYKRGHSVLIELVNRGMLEKQEDNFVAMGGALLEVNDRRRLGFCGTASLGLPNVFEDGKWEGLGKITCMDGVIKSLVNGDEWDKFSTLLIDGNRLCREVPDSFFQRLQGLQVLALFNPGLRSVPKFLSNLQMLLVLVLRGCSLLVKVDHVQELQTLTVLEISGASSLKEIPDNLFEQMPDLQSLNLSANQLTSLPSSIFTRSKLRWLILRGCSQLKALPTLKELRNLEVLDLSGATSLNSIKDRNLGMIEKLQFLDLSQTHIERLPFLHNLEKLTRVLLSGCSRIARLPILTSLTSLQILDLSDATMLKEIQDDYLQINNVLIVLDLSGTAISRFPSNICNLSNLFLRGCSELVKLPYTAALKDLELINLSDAAVLDNIEDRSFEHLRFLWLLNFSNTKVERLPALSNLSSLRELLLKGCSLLKELPEMNGLTRLEVLDLSGARSLQKIEHLNHENLRRLSLHGCCKLYNLPSLDALQKLEELDLSGCEVLNHIQDRSFDKMTNLTTLDLSETKIQSLPSLSTLSSLSHLSLRGCRDLKGLPPLESLSELKKLDLCDARDLGEIQAEILENMIHLQILNFSGIRCNELESISHLESLTNLEILDLSSTKIKKLPSMKIFSNLRELRLRDCSNIDGLPDLESLSHLEVLDLFGTKIKEFPYEISEFTRLKYLHMPELKIQIKWEKIKFLPEELNLEEWGILKFDETPIQNGKPSISVTGTKLFEFLKKNPMLWETCFRQFHFSVLSAEQSKGEDMFCHRAEYIRDVFIQTRKLSSPNEQYRSVEIHGFHTFPTGVEDVLRCAELVYLIENKFVVCLSDLGAENIKGCWIERCNNMESILIGKENPGRWESSLEVLWLSNMANLKNLCSSILQSESFKNLKELCLDCCPMLVNVFSSSQVLENLEILKIKFCDRVETLFGDKMLAEREVQKLHTLHLLELPELKSIGVILPSLQVLKVRECPNLLKLEMFTASAGNLQSNSCKELRCLTLESCPMLVNLFSSLQQPENLETLQLKFCDNLETVFEIDGNASAERTLPNLRRLHMWNLPKLKSIGAVLPSQLTMEVRECPKLEQSPVM